MLSSRSLWVALFLAACGAPVPPGLTVATSTVGDTTVLDIRGDLPDSLVRHAVAELTIAPGADDTTLFATVAEAEIDRSGRFWVFDRSSLSLFVFAPDGRLVRRIGRKGAGPGEFQSGNGIAILGDSGVAIWDRTNSRIAFFDTAGVHRTDWRTPGGYGASSALLSDDVGGLYLMRPVAPAMTGEFIGRIGLTIPRPDGSLADSLIPPVTPVVRVMYLSVGKEGGRAGDFPAYGVETRWAWHPGGWFVTADGRGTLLLSRTKGGPVLMKRRFTPVTVSEEERALEQAEITSNLRYNDSSWSWPGPDLPKEKAPFLGLFAARDGRIWVRVAAPSVRVPPPAAEPGDTVPPQPSYRMPLVYEVYTAEGEFVMRVAFPGATRIIEADGENVWGVTLTEDGLQGVVRYRVG